VQIVTTGKKKEQEGLEKKRERREKPKKQFKERDIRK